MKIIRLSFSYDVLIMNLNASCGNHSMGLFRAFKSLLRRPSQRPLYVVGRLGRGEKARGGRWNSISSHRPPRACCFFLLLLGCLCGPVINSAFGRRCRKVVSRGGKTRGSGTEKRCSHKWFHTIFSQSLARILFVPRFYF